MRWGRWLLSFVALVPLVTARSGGIDAAGAVPVDGLPDIVAGTPETISPGVEVFPIMRSDPLLQGRVARLSPEAVRQRLRLVVSNDRIAETTGPRRETTSSMCRRYRCVVGVNADQWYVNGADPSTPIGGTVVEGELWRTPEPDPNPFISMGQLQFDAAGTPDARPAPAGWTATLEGQTDEGPVTLDVAVNRIPRDGEVALYTHRRDDRTPVDAGVTEWAVNVGAIREGATPLSPASGGLTGGGTPLSETIGVLAARGPEAAGTVGAVLAGPAAVRVDMLGAFWANGGFPVLMEGGEYTILPDDPDNNRERAARTMAGWTAGGALLLVTVDERPGWSAGLTVTEAARLMRTLGADEAINLDGGGSATFVEGGFVANRPSDGTDAPVERAVVDALVIVPPEGIDFARPSVRSTAVACPDPLPPPPFDDLGADPTHVRAVACVAARRIASGIGPRLYGPTVDVSRAQMATFLERLLLAAGVGVPGEAPDAFVDDEASLHETAINRLAAMGVVGGVGGGRYDPEGRVTRAQMATFLARSLWIAQGGAVFGAEHDYFADDPLDRHQPNINVIAEHGIAGGVAPDTYHPGGHVSRAQMASFLARTLDAALAS